MAEKKSFQQKLEDYSDGVVKSLNYDRLRIWKEIFFHPTKTFTEQNPKAQLGRGAKDVFISAIPGIVLGLLFILIYAAVLSLYGAIFVAAEPALAPLFSLGVGAMILLIILYVISPVVWWIIASAVQYIVAKLLGGKANFRQHAYMTALAIASATAFTVPFMILSLVPCINYIAQPVIMLIGFYGIYLQFSGVRVVHKISDWKSAVVALIPMVLLILIIVGLYMALVAGMVAFVSAAKAA